MKEAKNKYTDLSDEGLMDLYQKGDFPAFQEIYLRHSKRVYQYLKVKTNSVESAQDLMQEVFEKLHHNRDKYNSQFPFLPWVFTISRNTLLDHYKKAESKLVKNSVFEEGIFEKLAEPALVDSHQDFSEILKDLSPTQKRAIELRYLSDWSFNQIARELSTSEENIRQLISRGIKKLKLSFKKGDSNE